MQGGQHLGNRGRLLVWHSRPMTVVRTPVPLFGARVAFNSVVLEMPHWFVVVVLAAIFALIQRGLPRRFSLRTLLVATTLVAIVLGLVVAFR
jgi:hypothetical protein